MTISIPLVSRRLGASLVALALALIIASGCAGSPPAVDIIGYAATPVPTVGADQATAASSVRRPTRAPSAASRGATATIVPPASGTAAVAGSADGGSDASPTPTVELTTSAALSAVDGTQVTPVISQISSRASRSPRRTPGATRSPTSGLVPGEVDASVGRFVTSDTRSTRYNYPRDDTRWRRIRAIHQKWFATLPDLLKAFPGRVPRATTTRRPTRLPSTPTATITSTPTPSG